jgi:predicted SAM-dependent methyltransferase
MKLHLGCGSKHIPGWVHVDVMDYPHIDHVHSVDSLPMVADGEVETIYACHVLEHFNKKEIPRVLAEWRRALRPGGILRCPVPDFEAHARIYLSSSREDVLDTIHGPVLGGQTYLYNFHYTLFDWFTIKRTLETAGFVDVRQYEWRETEHADLDDFSQSYLPHMDKENGILHSLNVEATR